MRKTTMIRLLFAGALPAALAGLAAVGAPRPTPPGRPQVRPRPPPARWCWPDSSSP
jgi:hypothetical protein